MLRCMTLATTDCVSDSNLYSICALESMSVVKRKYK